MKEGENFQANLARVRGEIAELRLQGWFGSRRRQDEAMNAGLRPQASHLTQDSIQIGRPNWPETGYDRIDQAALDRGPSEEILPVRHYDWIADFGCQRPLARSGTDRLS